MQMLKITSVFSERDIALCPDISDISRDIIKQNSECRTMFVAEQDGGRFISPANELARQFFDAELDEHFRSTITEARVYLALYKNFEQEIDDIYLKQSILELTETLL
jgi:hypothetical protein